MIFHSIASAPSPWMAVPLLIIGFAGGGGIGFLLPQNINLINYRAVSAQIVAIAIVVSIMDYVSSVLWQRVV